MLKKTLAAILAVAGTVTAVAQPQLRKDNIDEVIKAMTLEEKATLLVGGGWGSMNAGSMTASSTILVPGAAGTTRGIDRLGIPRTVLSDGPAGLRIEPKRQGSNQTYYCTGFPVGTSMASTWNLPLVEEFTTAMGNEVLEYGADVLLAPGLNLHRNPLCGRNFEYYSEDPFLTGKMAAAYTRGVQSNGVGVSIKHFAANSQETNRQENDALISVRALREMYLKGFEIAVKESDPWTVMSSYNRLNGQFTQQNRDLLTTILRDEWGFNGIVMTDWGTKEGTVKAVNAGNDLMEPGAEIEIERIIAGVKDGSISEAQLNTNVRRMLEYIVRTPRFNKYKYSDKPDLKAHAELVRKGAAEAMVLLKNDATLPMKDVKSVALYGVGSYDFIAGGTGSGNVNKAYIRNIEDGLKVNGYEVNETIAGLYHKYIDYTKAVNAAGGAASGILLGDAVLAEMNVIRGLIERQVANTDIAIITISRNAGEGGDRKAADGDFTLTAQEREMIQNVSDIYHVAGKKAIVVLNIGGVIETASWKNTPDAILLAWTPGQEGGYTVADVLSGASYPSGKLPMTFPVSYFDIPSSYNFPYNYSNNAGRGRGRGPVKDVDNTQYQEGIWVGYRYFATAGKAVSYPFGFGLGYTTFAYSAPYVKVAKDGTMTAAVTVKNTGAAAGKEAVQIYVTAPDGGLVKPEFELKAFAKTRELKPGESETLTMTIDPYTLASFNEATSAWETAAGTYKVLFGASSEDIRCNVSVKVAKAQAWPVHDVMHPANPVQEIAVE